MLLLPTALLLTAEINLEDFVAENAREVLVRLSFATKTAY